MSSSVMLGGDMPQDLFSGGGAPAPRLHGEAVRFFMRTVVDQVATLAAGCPKHKSAEYIEIRVPGDKTNVVERAVRPNDTVLYAHAYAAFKAGDKEQVVGTALEHWPPAAAHVVEDLKHLKIRTVEQLAAVSDANLPALGIGGRSLRDQALAWLELAKGGEPIARMTAENEALRQRIDGLTVELEGIKAAMAKQSRGK